MSEVTSYDVRAELERRLERDLLGPWDGPQEELERGRSPAERYVLGRLVPRDVARFELLDRLLEDNLRCAATQER